MTAKLLTTFKKRITGMKLIPSGGGCFELTANGKLIYSKLQVGKFPDEKAIIELVEKTLSA